MAKRISATRQQYNIERERAARRIQRQVKVPISVAREMLPKVPQRVTQKSISELKAIRGKHGKYTRNFIQELYSQYISDLQPEELKQFFKRKTDFAKESTRRSEIARKSRALPEKDTMPSYSGVQYDETVGDEVYVTLNEIQREIEKAIQNAQKEGFPTHLYAEELRSYLMNEIRIQGKQKVGKQLQDAHDDAIIAANQIIYGSTSDIRDTGWATMDDILHALNYNDHALSAALSTAQMDEAYADDYEYGYDGFGYGYDSEGNKIDPKTGEIK